ncbi:Hypothetical predicted protein [Xyrichtys novacula]|uniref:Uncharacterized protein n=1 Tax=Xyrichtys novacula TaxID=13765 RepID=A0AAV1EZG7_XYRNO|nr:Hypothetical predicted protein [Xyrichtys novacula]
MKSEQEVEEYLIAIRQLFPPRLQRDGDLQPSVHALHSGSPTSPAHPLIPDRSQPLEINLTSKQDPTPKHQPQPHGCKSQCSEAKPRRCGSLLRPVERTSLLVGGRRVYLVKQVSEQQL